MVNVTGIGIISSLGVGVNETLNTLKGNNVKETLRKPLNFSTKIDVPVGEVEMTNDELKSLLGIDKKKTISRTALLGIVAAKEAIRDAGIEDLDNTCFISSTTVGGMDMTPTFYREYMGDNNKGRLRHVAQHDCASSTRMIAEACGIGGMTTAISTACSSAANAIMMGARMIEQGLAERVVVGGTDALCAYTIDGFKSLMILDSEKCRPFDETRAGLNLGEAAAYIVLEADKGKKQTYCQVTGYANANDAYHQTAVSAEGRGPQKAMREALKKAGIEPEDISYINAHGTGTPNNDASESAAIKAIWGKNIPAFSSTKAMTGHTLAAAGAIEAVFSVLAIKEQMVWGNKNFSTPIAMTGLTPTRETTHCEVNAVMSNSFGFGGNCSAVIFEKNSSRASLNRNIKHTLYINATATYNAEWDLKSIITDANMRRRMSRLVKMGVATGLKAAEGQKIDSIITATSYGCLSDSEKFLKTAIETDEQMLTPTPFIQSTFNTIGGTLALLMGCEEYNMTFVNREKSMSDMIIDAAIEIASGKKNVLIGLIDEMTPTLETIIRRMGKKGSALPHDDGAWFYVVSATKGENCIGTIEVDDIKKTYSLR